MDLGKIVRFLGFVSLNFGVFALGAHGLLGWFPPLQGDPARATVEGLALGHGLAAIVVLYPLLARARSSVARATLYAGAFFLAGASLSICLAVLWDGPGVAVLGTFAVALYGAPLLLALLALNKLASPLLLPRAGAVSPRRAA